MSNYIEEKLKEFDREFVKNLGDMIEAIFLDPNGSVNPIKQFIKQALEEQEERIIKKIKSLPRYTFLTDKREFIKQDAISREAVIKILNQDKLL